MRYISVEVTDIPWNQIYATSYIDMRLDKLYNYMEAMKVDSKSLCNIVIFVVFIAEEITHWLFNFNHNNPFPVLCHEFV